MEDPWKQKYPTKFIVSCKAISLPLLQILKETLSSTLDKNSPKSDKPEEGDTSLLFWQW